MAEPVAPTAEDEAAVVLRARADLHAFEPVYVAYHPRILAYCRRRLGSPEDAADATAQTFAKALAGVEGFGGGSVAAWLFTIARRVVIDMVRARRPGVDLDAAAELVEPGEGPVEAAVAADERRALEAAIGRLTPEQAEILRLRMAGLAGQQIADVLGLSLSAVKSSQFRAFARLRTLLADQRPPGEPR